MHLSIASMAGGAIALCCHNHCNHRARPEPISGLGLAYFFGFLIHTHMQYGGTTFGVLLYLRVPRSNTSHSTLLRWVTPRELFSSSTVLTSSLRSTSEGTQLVLNLVLYRSMSVEHEGSVKKLNYSYFLCSVCAYL